MLNYKIKVSKYPVEYSHVLTSFSHGKRTQVRVSTKDDCNYLVLT